jgi:hypothetical protein
MDKTVSSTRLNSQAQIHCCVISVRGGGTVSSEKGTCPSIQGSKAGRMDMTKLMQGEDEPVNLPAHTLAENQFAFPEEGKTS